MNDSRQLSITRRPRRLRRTAALRNLVAETALRPADLIQPLFVMEGTGADEPIPSMPGQKRWTLDSLVKECRYLYAIGIPAVALFPKLAHSLKNARGTEALNPDTLILQAIRAVKAAVPQLAVIADIALDPYTDHGHDGLLNANCDNVENDRTIAVLAEMAVLNAQAGADFVAPSDMMDGRVTAIRTALDELSLIDTGIMAYSAKFSSAYYGPFRDAVGSISDIKPVLFNKDTYQCQPTNRREGLLEALLDEQEGADILMIKPAGPYLDIIREIREHTLLPIAAYQVSGEYAQLHAAADRGWLDLVKCRDESLLGIKRAGADMILTYFAKEVAEELNHSA